MDGSVTKLEVTWGRALTVWWSLAWRSIVLGGLAGAIAGAFIGMIAGLLGQVEKAQTWGSYVGQIVSIPVSMIVVKIILKKKWKKFSIVLVPKED